MKALDRFTVEQLNDFIESDHAQCGDVAALARIALAAKRDEPVAYWNDACDLDDGAFSYANDAGCTRPLYTTPQLNSPEIPDYKSALLGLLMSCISKDHLGFFTLAGINKTNLIQAVEVSGATINFDNVPQVNIGECLIPKGWIITPEIQEGWIKCSDRMPEDDTLCLGVDECGVVWTMHFDDGEFQPDTGDVDDLKISHWMPLPDSPEKPL